MKEIDNSIIEFAKRNYVGIAKLSIFIIYFWFGILKVIGASPASPMVLALLDITMPFIEHGTFLILFGLLEVFIGITFLIPRIERFSTALMLVHLVTTTMPLLLLPGMVWTGILVPTMEGQYIIKNILLIALAFVIISRLKPLRS
jgi:uncharacterized membrane protein YkgB